MSGVKIISIGCAIPGKDNVPGTIMSNWYFAQEMLKRGNKIADEKNLTGEERKKFLTPFTTDHDWIETRTGIRERPIAPDGFSTSDLGAIAVARALESANLSIQDIDFIFVGTVSHSHRYSPMDATEVLRKVRFDFSKEINVADISAACTSSMVALHHGVLFGSSGQYKRGIILCVDIMHSTVNYNDRSFSILMSDIGIAIVIEEEPILENCTFTLNGLYSKPDGRGWNKIITKSGGSANSDTEESIIAGENKLFMEGKIVFKDIIQMFFPENKLPIDSPIMQACTKAGVSLHDIKHIFPHQANLRMLKGIAEGFAKAGFDPSRIYNNIEYYGNSTSASIPLLMFEAYIRKILKKGDLFMLLSFGGGYTCEIIIGKWTL